MTIFHFALLRSLRKKSTLITILILPAAMILIPPLWTEENAIGFSFFGITILYGAFLLVRSIMTDRESRTIVRIFAAPVTTFQYLFQNLLGYLVLLMAQILLFALVGSLLYGWQASIAGKLVLGYGLFAAVSIALSLAWNSLFRSSAISGGIFSVVVSVMALLGGVFVPLSLLPDILQTIGMLFPTFWLSSILMDITGGNPPFEFWVSGAVLALFTTAFLIFGSKRRLE
ncbi:ABC transporter permease [Lacrimispora sp.]|uniref:ABC transporter permease n=1 Tax=Lacrimispora sp. TaxID=2719234 RepID=UPI003461093A